MSPETNLEPSSKLNPHSTSPKHAAKWGLIAFALLLGCLPYLYAYARREDRVYLWLGFNFDDACVYLSWIRQAATNSNPFRVFNLFTTDAQGGMTANPLFLALGLLSRLTHLAPITVFHLTRVLFGGLLFRQIGKLLETLQFPKKTYLVIFATVAFSSGLGWIPGLWDINSIQSPIDRWQPEAITFLCLLLTPLFLASLCLQVMTLDFLLRSEDATDPKNARKMAIFAGICAALLTLIHTYDLISLSVVWSLYLVYRFVTLKEKSAKVSLTTQTAIAGIIVLPALFWMYLSLKQNALFSARVAVETLSPSVWWVIVGYGGTLALALVPFANLRKKPPISEENAETSVSVHTLAFIGLWTVGQILASYLPVSFQRKMIQGAHLPIAILAGFAIWSLWIKMNAGKTKKIPLFAFAGGIILLLSLSNIRFVLREMSNSDANLVQTGRHRAYLSEPEFRAIEWIEANTKPDDAVQALPWLSLNRDPETGHRLVGLRDLTMPVLIPALTGRRAYCAHFGETPDFGGKLSALMQFTSGKMPLPQRLEFRKEMKVDYLLFTQTPAITNTDSEIATNAETAFRETTTSDRQENSLISVILTTNVR